MSLTAEDLGPNVHFSSHPVLSHKISILRNSETQPAAFRAIMREVTYHLGYEATSTLTTEPTTIHVNIPKEELIECQGNKIKERVAMVPILRSGLGMVDSMLELIPNAAIHHIGMYKVIGSPPVQYFNRLPKKCEVDVAYVVDPVISTSSTVSSVVRILQKWGVKKIHIISVIGAHAGLLQLVKSYPDIYITVGVVDHEVSASGFVLPGLGDSGDRLFGTHVPLTHDEATPSRKRSFSQE